MGNILINQFNQSIVPPEQLTEKEYKKAYRRALIAEARHHSKTEEAFINALTTVLKAMGF